MNEIMSIRLCSAWRPEEDEDEIGQTVQWEHTRHQPVRPASADVWREGGAAEGSAEVW